MMAANLGWAMVLVGLVASSAWADELQPIKGTLAAPSKDGAEYIYVALRCTGLSKAFSAAVVHTGADDAGLAETLSAAGPAFLGVVADAEGEVTFEQSVESAAAKSDAVALDYTDRMIANVNAGKPFADALIMDDLVECRLLADILM